MDDSKIFMFPDAGTRQTSSDVNSLLPLLMCNGGFGGGNWIWIIFLFFLYPLMRNGGLFGNAAPNGGGGCLGDAFSYPVMLHRCLLPGLCQRAMLGRLR